MNIKLVCRCNLDLRNEQWPEYMNHVPQVGDYIQSRRVHRTHNCPQGVQLELQVKRVTWKYKEDCWPANTHSPKGDWYAELDLHLGPHPFENISHFENWYDKTCGVISDESYRRREEARREEARNHV